MLSKYGKCLGFPKNKNHKKQTKHSTDSLSPQVEGHGTQEPKCPAEGFPAVSLNSQRVETKPQPQDMQLGDEVDIHTHAA